MTAGGGSAAIRRMLALDERCMAAQTAVRAHYALKESRGSRREQARGHSAAASGDVAAAAAASRHAGRQAI
eukprot:COSAG01_NODE_9103_length_2554_cov_1.459063_3_plen_71_part_00